MTVTIIQSNITHQGKIETVIWLRYQYQKDNYSLQSLYDIDIQWLTTKFSDSHILTINDTHLLYRKVNNHLQQTENFQDLQDLGHIILDNGFIGIKV